MVTVAIQLTSQEEDPIFTPSDSIFERVLNIFYDILYIIYNVKSQYLIM